MKISQRLENIVNSLPLKPDIRILEIGCGPGVAAREIANRMEKGHILAIDRSRKAIELAVKNSKAEIESGKLSFRNVAVEDFELEAEEEPYDFAFAVRVGALDGRHPKIEQIALARIAKSLTRNGKLFIDGGNPLKEISLRDYR